MDTTTREMIEKYKIKKLKLDFMGFTYKYLSELTYHHLIIAHKDGGKRELWNGAILTQNSHEYLHLIERLDYETFYLITSEMIDQNIKGKIDIENLKYIRELLLHFEAKHIHDKNKKGKQLIKYEFLIRPELDTIKLI